VPVLRLPEDTRSSFFVNRPRAGGRLAKGRYTGYEVTGEIHHKSGGKVKFTQITALVFDSSKKIIGSGTAFSGAGEISPGDYGPFAIRLIQVQGEPASFILDYEAREVQ